MPRSEASSATSHGWPAKAIAKAIIEQAAQRQLDLRIPKLHKLVYFAHGLMLARHGRALVQEPFEVWMNDPMTRDLFYSLKFYGPASLRPDQGFIPVWENLDPQAREEHTVISQVLDQLGSHSAAQLIAMSKAPSGPWSAAVTAKADHLPLANEQIATYFKTLLH